MIIFFRYFNHLLWVPMQFNRKKKFHVTSENRKYVLKLNHEINSEKKKNLIRTKIDDFNLNLRSMNDLFSI